MKNSKIIINLWPFDYIAERKKGFWSKLYPLELSNQRHEIHVNDIIIPISFHLVMIDIEPALLVT